MDDPIEQGLPNSFVCRCGTPLVDSPEPRFVPEAVRDSIEQVLVSRYVLDSLPEVVRRPDLALATTPVLRCWACNRLWVYWGTSAEGPTEYIPAYLVRPLDRRRTMPYLCLPSGTGSEEEIVLVTGM